MPNTSKSHPLIRLWGYAGSHHRDMLLASLYSILNKIFDLAPPLLIGAVVDTVVQQQDAFITSLGVLDVKTQLLVLAPHRGLSLYGDYCGLIPPYST